MTRAIGRKWAGPVLVLCAGFVALAGCVSSGEREAAAKPEPVPLVPVAPPPPQPEPIACQPCMAPVAETVVLPPEGGIRGVPVPPPEVVPPVGARPPNSAPGVAGPVVEGPPRYLPSVFVSDDPASPCSQDRQAPGADAATGYTCIDLLFATNRAHPWVEPFSGYDYPADPARFFRDRPLYDTGVRGASYPIRRGGFR
ncbi:MAG: hypothetical protein AAF253_13845 [Pseudomonadota bacterium]